jgi:hypothetical protein
MASKPGKEGSGIPSLRFYAQLSGIFTLYEEGTGEYCRLTISLAF